MRRTFLACAACAGCAAVLALGLRAAGPMTDPDEAAWIFSSYAYRLAFLDPGGLLSPEWKGADALDHPPLAKYMVGAALASEGLVPVSLSDKDYWFERAFLPYDHAAFVESLRRRVSVRALFLSRLASGAAMFCACALTAAAGDWLISAEAGLLAAFLLVTAAITRVVAAEAVSDGLFVALELACALAQASWAARLARDKRFSPGRSLLCGALAAALFDTKISGALELPLLAAALVAALACEPRSHRLRRAVLSSAAAAAAAGLLVVVALNPSLYSRPFSFVLSMFRHRRDTLAIQRLVYFGGEFQTARDLLCGAMRGLFWPDGGGWLAAATGALACAGFVDPRRRLASAPVDARVFMLHGALWTAATLAGYRVDWPRYLLPILPFACLLAASGAAQLAERRSAARVRLGLAAVAAATVLIYPASLFTPLRFWRGHAAEYQLKIDRQIPYLLGRYPSDRAAIQRGETDARSLLDRLRGAP